MRVVLPGEADAAVHLDVELGAGHKRRQGQRRRQRTREQGFVVGRVGARGIPHARRRLLGRHQHIRAVVLYGLEGADRAAELNSDLRVLRSHLGARVRAPRGFGGRQHPAQAPRGAARAAQQPLVRDANARAAHLDDAAAGVETLAGLDLDAVLVPLDQHEIVAHRQEQQICQAATEHQARGARDAAVGRALERAAEAERSDRGSVGQAGQNGLAQRVAAALGDHGRG